MKNSPRPVLLIGLFVFLRPMAGKEGDGNIYQCDEMKSVEGNAFTHSSDKAKAMGNLVTESRRVLQRMAGPPAEIEQ